jgi:hypothetical protein
VFDCEKNRKNELKKFGGIHKKIQTYQDCSRDTKLAPADNNQEARMAYFFCGVAWELKRLLLLLRNVFTLKFIS